MTPMEAELVAALRNLGHSVAETNIPGLWSFNGRELTIGQLQQMLRDAPTDGPTLRELLNNLERKDQP